MVLWVTYFLINTYEISKLSEIHMHNISIYYQVILKYRLALTGKAYLWVVIPAG